MCNFVSNFETNDKTEFSTETGTICCWESNETTALGHFETPPQISKTRKDAVLSPKKHSVLISGYS